jgi:hypothetical protein
MEKFDANFGNSTVTEQPLMQHSFSQIIDLYLYFSVTSVVEFCGRESRGASF